MSILDTIDCLLAEETVEVRNLREGETLPKGLCEGFDDRSLAGRWVWLLELKDGNGGASIVGALVAGTCQNLVILGRLGMLPGHSSLLPRLLRGFLTDVLARGYSGYVCYLGTTDVEEKLKKILRRAGAMEFDSQTCFGGKIEEAARW